MKHLNDSQEFIEYSRCMDNVCNNLDDYNPASKRKNIIVLSDMIADIMSNK